MESLLINNPMLVGNPFHNYNNMSSILANQQPSPTTSESPVTIELENGDLWRKFNHVGSNEMILTKSGRRMFPTLRFRLSGMDPNGQYAVVLEFVPVDSCRYRFVNGQWGVSGRGDHSVNEATSQMRLYAHPDSPAPGRLWMKSPVSFHKVKLTNNLPTEPRGHVLLHSMHKYQPRVHVVRLNEFYPVPRLVACYSCPELSFIAVTAYQNEKVIQLKIDHNPFAKGFRESDKKGLKRESPVKTEELQDANGSEIGRAKRLRSTSSTSADDTFESSSSSSGSVGSISPPIDNGTATPLDLSVKSSTIKSEAQQQLFSPSSTGPANIMDVYRQAAEQMQFGFNPFMGPFANFTPFSPNFLSPMSQVCPPTPPYRYQMPNFNPGMNEQAEFLRQRLMASAFASMNYSHC